MPDTPQVTVRTTEAGRVTEVVVPGERVRVRDVRGDWHEAIADSAIEGTHRSIRGQGARMAKVHDFPVVWIKFTESGPRLPWPAEDVTCSLRIAAGPCRNDQDIET